MGSLRSRHRTGLAIFALLVLAAAGCQGGDPANDNDPDPVTDQPPEIKNLLIDFGRYDSAAGRAGPFPFDPSKTKVFYEFNAEVPTPEGPKFLPTFEYHLVPDANVYAPADGYVTMFKYQAGTGDYEIGITRSPNLTLQGTGMVTVDHLKDPTVSQGDYVTAGQLLGKPGPWIVGMSKTELMVYRNDTAYCPFAYMSDSLKAGFRQKLRDLMADWEAYKHDTTIYDQASMVEPGCNDLAGIP